MVVAGNSKSERAGPDFVLYFDRLIFHCQTIVDDEAEQLDRGLFGHVDARK